jgi:CSLREA domain-containing protein
MHAWSIGDALRAALIVGLFVAWPAAAATITVTTLADELNANGNCSLREALQAANANSAVDACTAGTPGLDTVVLPAGTMPLSVTINVTDAVTIRGLGRASTTIQRGATTAFNGTGVVGATLTLEDLAVVGEVNTGGTQDIAITRVDFTGSTGTIVNSLNGAITIADATMTGGVNTLNGTIAIANSTLTGDGVNSSGGALSVTDTTVNGGGVNSSSGTLSLTRARILNAPGTGVNTSTSPITLVDSTVEGAGNDGVNSGSGAISITRSTIAGNGDDGVGSGMSAVSIVNSTVSGNGGVGIVGNGTITLNAVTVAGNGEGGLTGSGTFSLMNTIVALHAGTEDGDCANPVASAQGSLDSDNSCGLNAANNRPGVNPLLGPLANNGGPTFTHLPQAGSPAIDAGSNAACQAVDQRGVARPVDGNGDGTATCDIGAVEAAGGVTPPPQPPPTQPPTDIPTLTEWGLVLLMVLVLLLAARGLPGRRRR